MKKHTLTKPVQEATPSLSAQAFSLNSNSKSLQISDFLLLTLLALLVAFLRSKFLKIPMERDEGFYMLSGKMLLEGKLPYVDFFDTRLPMLFYVYGFVAMVGTSLSQSSMAFMLVQVLTTWILYLTARNPMGRTAAFIATFSYIFLSLAPSLDGFARQSEHFVNLFMVTGLYFLFQTKELPTKKLIWAGVFLCLAMMVKHNAVTVLIFAGMYLLIEFYTPERFLDKRLVKSVGLFSLGVLAVIALLFGSIMVRGVSKEMFYWAFTHSGLYASRVSLTDGLLLFEAIMGRFLEEGYDVFFYPAVLGLLLIWLTKLPFKAKLQWVLLFVFCFFAIVPGFQFYAHYFLIWAVAIAFFVGWAIVGVQNLMEEYFPQIPVRFQSLIAVLLFSVGFGWHFSNLKKYYLTPPYHFILRSIYGNNAFPESIEIADYLKQHVQEGEPLGVFGSEQQLFLYTKTVPASRHTIMYHLLSDTTKSEKPALWQKEYIQEVEAAKPRYFVFFQQGTSLLPDPNCSQLLLNWIDKYLQTNYERVGVVVISPEETIYKWDAEATNYEAKGDDIVYVMKRKSQK